MDGMGNSSFRKFGLEMPDYFPGEYQLIIKLHPNLYAYRQALVNRLKDNIRDKKNILILENSNIIYDIVPVLAVADLLITDVSGVSCEHIAFLRPVIFLNNKSGLRFLYGSKRKKYELQVMWCRCFKIYLMLSGITSNIRKDTRGFRKR